MISLSCKTVFLSVVSVILTVSGIVLLCTHQDIFKYIYNTQLVLSPTSGSYPMWSKLPEPMLASMYLFEVKNPDQVSKGFKPVLEQRGPYVFTEQHLKVDAVWNDENGTVTYKQVRQWQFVPDKSNGSLSDQVTILNPVAATVGAMMKGHWYAGLVNPWLVTWKETLFVTHSVGDIIFNGYHDPLFDHIEDAIKALPFLKDLIPEGSLMDKFGFFYGRNNTDYIDGVWNMFTGAGDNSRMGKVTSWNYTGQLPWFQGECGKVKGGAGEFYPPGLEKTYIELFSNDLCRSLRFNFTRERIVKGINSYEFVADEGFFANGSVNPANACFDSQDIPSGLYDSSKCRFGAPVFVSQPHFYQADPYYSSLIQSGMAPNSSLHSTVFRVEPNSGIPLDVTARFQLNVLIEPIKNIGILEHVPKTYFPVMWFENKAGVPDELVFKMKLLANLHEILEGVGWFQLGIVLSIIIISTIVYLSRKKTVDKDQCPILSESINDDSQEEFEEE